MRSSRITADGTDRWPITITSGTTQFIAARVIPAGSTHLSHAMITFTEATPLAQRSATTGPRTRLEWRRVQSGSPAETWKTALAHRPDTLSAWIFSSHL